MRTSKHRLFLLFVGLYALSSMALGQVGMQTIQIGALPVTLVYPTNEVTQPHTFGSFQIDVALAAKAKIGIQRLIVLSHGSGGSSTSDHLLAATLVKAGYLVAQPLHTGDNYKDMSKAGPESWTTRPLEIIQTIDALAKDPQWSKLFDANKVGVHGMSAGGHTALTLAGGQWTMLTMLKHCAKEAEADSGFCLNGTAGDANAQAKRKQQFRAAAVAPEIYLPADLKTAHGVPRDTRIRAITASVPLSAPFTIDSLSKMTTPVGIVSASKDELLVPAFHSSYVLAHCKSCKLLTELKQAGHFDLVSPWPADVAQSVAAKQVKGGLPNPAFDAKDRTLAFESIVQFFNEALK